MSGLGIDYTRLSVPFAERAQWDAAQHRAKYNAMLINDAERMARQAVIAQKTSRELVKEGYVDPARNQPGGGR